MSLLKFVPLTLLGACVTEAPAGRFGPAARVVYGDLALESRADRTELRRRVAVSVEQFCRRHGDDVTPGELRLQASYCLDMLHASIVDAMPPRVRSAYRLSRDEAGVRGSRF